MPVKTISKESARLFLLGHLNLKQNTLPSGKEGFQQLVNQLRYIQFDPLSQIGKNHELVALARVDGLKLKTFYELLGPPYVFEHWAKERSFISANVFSYYMNCEFINPNFPGLRIPEEDIPPNTLDEVYNEIVEKGPIDVLKLKKRSKMTVSKSNEEYQMNLNQIALDHLWAKGKIVVGRNAYHHRKMYNIPSRAFPNVKKKEITEKEFIIWAIKERVEAAGFLSRTSNNTWSTLNKYRTTEIIDEMIKEGHIEEILIKGCKTRYLAPKDFEKRKFPETFDDRLRIIAPLDPLIWDRDLIAHVFDFHYVWEVYKPKSKRQYGYYVTPLLYKGRFVARMEAKLEKTEMVIKNIWMEKGVKFDEIKEAFYAAMQRHCDAASVKSFQIEQIHEGKKRKQNIETNKKKTKRVK